MADTIGKFYYEVGIKRGKDDEFDKLKHDLESLNGTLDLNVKFDKLKQAADAMASVSKSLEDLGYKAKDVQKDIANAMNFSELKLSPNTLTFIENFKKEISRIGGDPANIKKFEASWVESIDKTLLRARELKDNMLSMSGISVKGADFTQINGLYKNLTNASDSVLKSFEKINSGGVVNLDAFSKQFTNLNQMIEAAESLMKYRHLLSQGDTTVLLTPKFDVSKINADEVKTALGDLSKNLGIEISNVVFSGTALSKLSEQLNATPIRLENLSIGNIVNINQLSAVIDDLKAVKEELGLNLRQLMAQVGDTFSSQKGILPKGSGSDQIEIKNLVDNIREELSKIVLDIKEGHVNQTAIQMIEQELSKAKIVLENVEVKGVTSTMYSSLNKNKFSEDVEREKNTLSELESKLKAVQDAQNGIPKGLDKATESAEKWLTSIKDTYALSISEYEKISSIFSKIDNFYKGANNHAMNISSLASSNDVWSNFSFIEPSPAVKERVGYIKELYGKYKAAIVTEDRGTIALAEENLYNMLKTDCPYYGGDLLKYIRSFVDHSKTYRQELEKLKAEDIKEFGKSSNYYNSSEQEADLKRQIEAQKQKLQATIESSAKAAEVEEQEKKTLNDVVASIEQLKTILGGLNTQASFNPEQLSAFENVLKEIQTTLTGIAEQMRNIGSASGIVNAINEVKDALASVQSSGGVFNSVEKAFSSFDGERFETFARYIDLILNKITSIKESLSSLNGVSFMSPSLFDEYYNKKNLYSSLSEKREQYSAATESVEGIRREMSSSNEAIKSLETEITNSLSSFKAQVEGFTINPTFASSFEKEIEKIDNIASSESNRGVMKSIDEMVSKLEMYEEIMSGVHNMFDFDMNQNTTSFSFFEKLQKNVLETYENITELKDRLISVRDEVEGAETKAEKTDALQMAKESLQEELVLYKELIESAETLKKLESGEAEAIMDSVSSQSELLDRREADETELTNEIKRQTRLKDEIKETSKELEKSSEKIKSESSKRNVFSDILDTLNSVSLEIQKVARSTSEISAMYAMSSPSSNSLYKQLRDDYELAESLKKTISEINSLENVSASNIERAITSFGSRRSSTPMDTSMSNVIESNINKRIDNLNQLKDVLSSINTPASKENPFLKEIESIDILISKLSEYSALIQRERNSGKFVDSKDKDTVSGVIESIQKSTSLYSDSIVKCNDIISNSSGKTIDSFINEERAIKELSSSSEKSLQQTVNFEEAAANGASLLNEQYQSLTRTLERLANVMTTVSESIGKLFSYNGVFTMTAQIENLVSMFQNAAQVFAQAGGNITFVGGTQGVEQMTAALAKMEELVLKVETALNAMNAAATNAGNTTSGSGRTTSKNYTKESTLDKIGTLIERLNAAETKDVKGQFIDQIREKLLKLQNELNTFTGDNLVNKINEINNSFKTLSQEVTSSISNQKWFNKNATKFGFGTDNGAFSNNQAGAHEQQRRRAEQEWNDLNMWAAMYKAAWEKFYAAQHGLLGDGSPVGKFQPMNESFYSFLNDKTVQRFIYEMNNVSRYAESVLNKRNQGLLNGNASNEAAQQLQRLWNNMFAMLQEGSISKMNNFLSNPLLYKNEMREVGSKLGNESISSAGDKLRNDVRKQKEAVEEEYKNLINTVKNKVRELGQSISLAYSKGESISARSAIKTSWTTYLRTLENCSGDMDKMESILAAKKRRMETLASETRAATTADATLTNESTKERRSLEEFRKNQEKIRNEAKKTQELAATEEERAYNRISRIISGVDRAKAIFNQNIQRTSGSVSIDVDTRKSRLQIKELETELNKIMSLTGKDFVVAVNNAAANGLFDKLSYAYRLYSESKQSALNEAKQKSASISASQRIDAQIEREIAKEVAEEEKAYQRLAAAVRVAEGEISNLIKVRDRMAINNQDTTMIQGQIDHLKSARLQPLLDAQSSARDINTATAAVEKFTSETLAFEQSTNRVVEAQRALNRENSKPAPKSKDQDAENLKKINEILQHQTNLYEQLNNAKNIRKEEGKSVYFLEKELDVYSQILSKIREIIAANDSQAIASQLNSLPAVLDNIKSNIAIARQNDNAPMFVNIDREREKLSELEGELQRIKTNFTIGGPSEDWILLSKINDIERFRTLISEVEKDLEKLESTKGKSDTKLDLIDALKKEIEAYKRYIEEDKRVLEKIKSNPNEKEKETLQKIEQITAAIEKQKQVISELQSQKLADNSSSLWSKATASQKQFDSQTMQTLKSIMNLDQQFSMLAMNIQNTFSIIGLQQFANEIIKIGGELERQQLAMGSIFGSDRKADSIYKQVADLSMKSPFTVQDLVKNTKQLSAFGVEYDKLYDTTKRLSDIAAAVGVDFGRIAYEYGQMESMGYLDARHLRMFSMSGIPLAQELAKYYSQERGVDVGVEEVRKMMMKRQVGADVVKQILQGMTDEGGKFYNMQEIMAESLASKYANLENKMSLMYGDLAKSGVGDFLKYMAESLTAAAGRWKELSAVVVSTTAAFTISKVLLAANSALMQKEAVAALQLAMTQKGLTEQQAISATIEKSRILGKEAIVAESYKEVLANTALSSSQKMCLIATSQLDTAEKVAILTKMGLTEAEAAYVIGTDAATAATVRLRVAIVSISKFLSTNAWAIFAVVTAGMVAELYSAVKATNELGNSLEEIRSKSESEGDVLANEFDILIKKLGEAKDDQEEYGKIVDEINNKYSSYIGNLSRESSEYDNIAEAATRAKNAIREKLKTQAIEDSVNEIKSSYEDGLTNSRKDVSDLVKEAVSGLGLKISPESLTAKILDYARSGLSDADIQKKLENEYGDKLTGSNGRKFSVKALSRNFVGDRISGMDSWGLDVYRKRWNEMQSMIEETYSGYGHSEYSNMLKPVNDYYDNLKKNTKDQNELLKIEEKRLVAIIEMLTKGGTTIGSAEGSGKGFFVNGVTDAAEEDIKKYKDQLNEIRKDLNTGWYTDANKFFTDKRVRSSVFSDLDKSDVNAFKEGLKKKKEEAEKIIKDYKEEISKNGKLAERDQERYELAEETKKEIDAYAKARKIDWSKVGKDTKNTNKKDKTEEQRIQNQIRLIREAYNEYKNLKDVIGSVSAAKKVEGGSVVEELFNVEGFNKDEFNVANLLGNLKIVRNEAKKLKDKGKITSEELVKINLEIGKIEDSIDTDKLKEIADQKAAVIKDELDKKLSSWDLFENLKKKGVEQTIAFKVAFDAKDIAWDEQSNDMADMLIEKMNTTEGFDYEFMMPDGTRISKLKNAGENIKDALFSLTENEAKYLFASNSGLKEWWDKIREYLKKNRIDSLLDESGISEELNSVSQKLNKLTNDYNDDMKSLGSQFKNGLINKEQYDRKASARTSMLNWESSKLNGNYYMLFNRAITTGLDDATKAMYGFKKSGKYFKGVIDELDDMLNHGAISAEDYSKNLKEINERMQELSKNRNTLTSYLNGGFDNIIKSRTKLAEESISSGEKLYNQGLEAQDKGMQEQGAAMKANGNQMKASGKNMMKGAQGFANSVAIIDAIIHGINNAIQGLNEAYNSIKELADSIGKDTDSGSWKDWGTFMDAFSNMSAKATSGWDKLKNGDAVGAVTDNVSGWLGIFTKYNRSYDDKVKKENEELQKSIDRLKDAFDNYTSTLESTGYSGTDAYSKILNRQKAYLKELNVATGGEVSDKDRQYMRDVESGGKSIIERMVDSLPDDVGKHNSSRTNWRQSVRYDIDVNTLQNTVGEAIWNSLERELNGYKYIEIGDLKNAISTPSSDLGKILNTQYLDLVEQRKLVEDQLAGQLSLKDPDDDQIENYKKEIQELTDQILDFSETVAKDVFGLDFSTWASNISDAIVEAFNNGEDAIQAFDDTVNDMLNDVVSSIIRIGIIQPAIEKLKNAIFGYTDDEGNVHEGLFKITDPESSMEGVVEFLRDWAEGEGKTTAEAVEYALDAAEKAGIYKKPEDSSSSTSTSIKGITEETADILAAYLNAIRQDVSVDRSILEQILNTHLPIIEGLLGYGAIKDDSDAIQEGSMSKAGARFFDDETTEVSDTDSMMQQLTYVQIPMLNATASAQLAQLNMQTEYLRVIQENTAANLEAVDQVRNDLHSVIYGSNKVNI